MHRTGWSKNTFYVSFPLALAAAIGLEPGDQVQWELLDREELHLVRLEVRPPFGRRPARRKLAGGAS
ncbi:MAG: hypothetical protein ACP5MD_05380 [Verrucomicrobiia bacterium]